MRDLHRLGGGRYDTLVVGGGIYGLFAAYEAARRGLRVALVERDDFGAGLSFNHQRTIHGGLRALQGAHLRKVREQVSERRRWAVLAPALVRPLPFLVGTYGKGKRSRWALRLGLAAYDAIGRDRNVGLPASLCLPNGRVIARDEIKALFPSIDPVGLTGGALWFDYQTTHPDRLNWLVACAAMRAGAALFNHVDCVEPIRRGDRVAGARVRVWPSGEIADMEARTTLLCAGAGLGALHQRYGLGDAPPLLRAMNLVLDRPAPDRALAAPGRSGRMLTCVPWNGAALVGTFQSEMTIAPPEDAPPSAAIDAMLAAVRATFPHLKADRASIRVVHHGLTPAKVVGGRADLLAESQLLRHRIGGVYSLVGVKFTTAPLAAVDAVNVICRDLGVAAPAASVPEPLPFGTTAQAADDLDVVCRATETRLDGDVKRHLLEWYGGEAAEVARYAATVGVTSRLVPELPILAGEIPYACDFGMALRLTDAVLRRTRLGEMGHPGTAALGAAADLMTRHFGWTAEARAHEIARVERRFEH